MTEDLSNFILSRGKEAALRKMTLEKNLTKSDMRDLTFSELQMFLEQEVFELYEEVFKTPGAIPNKELLRAIQDEAGDVIAFASGIAAKAGQLADTADQEELLFN